MPIRTFLSLSPPSFFLSFFSLSPKKTRLSHSLLYPLIVPVSDRTRVARVCVCVCFATEIYVDAVCLNEENQLSRKFFSSAIFAILIHAYRTLFHKILFRQLKIPLSIDRAPEPKERSWDFHINSLGFLCSQSTREKIHDWKLQIKTHKQEKREREREEDEV